MVEHFIVMFDPDGPQRNAPKEVVNLNTFAVLFGNPFSKKCLFPLEALIIANSYPTKFIHNESGPSPCSPSLNVVPKFMFNRLACVREAKYTLLGN